jgi:hypothetical protein
MNKYSGDSFDDFLKEEGIFEEVLECTRKRVLALEIEDMVNAAASSKTSFFAEMNADLVELNHYLFDLDNTVITAELLKNITREAEEMKTDPVRLNDPLFDSEELLNRLLTEDVAA